MSTPDRFTVLDTAVRLFYTKGFKSIDVDDIERALGGHGDTVKRFFDSRESLIIAVLARRDQLFREELDNFVSAHAKTPVEQLLSTFDFLSAWHHSDGFHGCMFINACIEFPEKNDLINQAAAQHKQALYDFFRELTSSVCPTAPDVLSRQLVLLMEGAIVTTQVTGNTDAADQARRAAEILLTHSMSH